MSKVAAKQRESTFGATLRMARAELLLVKQLKAISSFAKSDFLLYNRTMTYITQKGDIYGKQSHQADFV